MGGDPPKNQVLKFSVLGRICFPNRTLSYCKCTISTSVEFEIFHECMLTTPVKNLIETLASLFSGLQRYRI